MSADLLVDTHVLLWFIRGDAEGMRLLEDVARDDGSTVSFSSISLSELAVKRSVGKLEIDIARLRRIARSSGFLELPFTGGHAEQLAQLPLHHRDPFDRMLIAQAMSEGLEMVTVDGAFEAYHDLRLYRP